MSAFLFMLVLFIANTVQVITGFAGNLLAMPFGIQLVGYGSSKVVLNIFTLVACSVITFKNRKYIQWRVLIKMLVFMMTGMAIGIFMLNFLSIDLLLYIYGAVIIIIALKKLLIKKEISVSAWLMHFVLLGAGIMHGLFVSGGALLVVYAVSVLKDKNEFRATLAPVWVILDLILIFEHAAEGLYSENNVVLIAVSLIPLIFSMFIGNMLFKKFNQGVFMKLTYCLLLLSGIMVFI